MKQDGHQKLFELLDDFKTAMLVTRLRNGGIHARPMHVAKLEEDGELYFVTSKDSPKIREIARDSEVNAIFQGNSKFVTMTGIASILDDRQLIESLWSEAWKVWFPKGKDDPTICIIKVVTSQAEYWDNEGLEGLSYAFAAAKAYIRGECPEVDSRHHGTLKV
jgi:general stress protein 26